MSKQRVSESATSYPHDASAVGIRDLRDHLSAHLERVKAGETLTITEHGKPIARIVGTELPPALVAMIARGEATPPSRPLSDLHAIKRVKITGTTQDLIDEIR